jgi:peptide/nickel transport system permease protein
VKTLVLTNKRWKYSLFLIKNSKALIMGLALLIFVLCVTFFGPLLVTANPNLVNLQEKLLPPSSGHPFGTDMLGRDILSRIVYGARNTMLAAAISVVIGLFFGVFLGGIAGYAGKKVDMGLMRSADILLAFPTLLLAMALCAALGPSLEKAALAVGISFIPSYMRLIRSKVLSVKEMEYVEAARAIGASSWRIFSHHVLPNSISPVFVASMVYAGFGILWTTSLSFIGLGAQPPTPEWGLMILQGRDYVLSGQWWVVAFPGIFIAIAVAAFNLIGDGLRDILSPKLRIT